MMILRSDSNKTTSMIPTYAPLNGFHLRLLVLYLGTGGTSFVDVYSVKP